MDNQITQPFKRSIGLVEADIEANCETHGVRGILKHTDILNMISEYDEDDKQARIFGKFQHLTGLVFKNFNRSVHVIRPFELDPKDWVVTEALDPHPRNNDAVVWLAVNAKGQKIVVDELYKGFLGTDGDKELARAIKDKAERYRVVKRLIDPAADVVDQHTGRSLKSDLYNMGLSYDLGSKARADAVRLIRNAFSYQMVNGVFVRPPELYIFESCTRLIWEIEHWQWQEWSSKSAQTRSPNEKPVDKDDHCIECLGRCLLADTQFVDITPIEANFYGNQAVLDNQRIQTNIDDPYN